MRGDDLRRRVRHEDGPAASRHPIAQRVGGLAALAVALSFGGVSAGALPVDDNARTVLLEHCARCHEAGRLENPPAKGALGDIGNLQALAAREDLVVPGDPDASRLYQILLARHRPLGVFFGPVPGPAPAEIQDVRDWLAGLPPAAPGCADRPLLTAADISRDAAAWRAAFEREGEASGPLRFVSLAALYNLCRSDERLAQYRAAVAMLLERIGGGRSRPTLDTVGEASALLAIRPGELGLTAEAWDARTGGDGEVPGVVAAEELAARVLREAQLPPELASGAQAASPAPVLIGGLDPVAALASEHDRTVTLRRAAAELAEAPEALTARIATLSGPARDLAIRLAKTGLPRPEWDALRPALAGGAPPAETPATGSRPLRLALWTSALDYASGDLLSVHARSSADCYLTVIAVDADGVATVLFPNDTAPDNRVTAGTRVTVPAADAPFQIRLDKPGRQTLVGICNARARRPEGVGHDFERQRFTVLGDWRTFLAATAEREAAHRQAQEEMRKFRARREGQPEPSEEQVPVGTEDEARAGLSFAVRDGRGAGQGSDP